jgi:hypothetical protein
MPLQPGSFLNNRYRIEDKLGRGGMGAVYLAHDQTLNIRVAVKENLNANPEAERQFKKEAELLAKLRHPHLARVTDYFILQDQQYLVMDYVEGIDLHARAAQSPPTVAEVLRWASDLGSALTYLHSRPQPIFIAHQAGQRQVQRTERCRRFRHRWDVSARRRHHPGARPAGPGNMPAASDTRWRLLYSLMTHVSPPDSIERMLNKEHLRPASSIIPNVPPHVDAALERAMSVDMEDRFPDIATFMAALRGDMAMETIRGPAAIAAAAGAGARAGAVVPPKRGNRMWLLALGGAALLGLILLGAGGVIALGALGSPAATSTPTRLAQSLEITSTPRPISGDATAVPAAEATATPTITATPAPLLGGGGRIVFVSDRADRRFAAVDHEPGWQRPLSADVRRTTS